MLKSYENLLSALGGKGFLKIWLARAEVYEDQAQSLSMSVQSGKIHLLQMNPV